MKIYTGFGDKGKTSLWGGEIVNKNDPRVKAFGTLDELNSVVGFIRSINDIAEIDVVLKSRQNEIFNLSSEMAASGTKKETQLSNRISLKEIEMLETEMDVWTEKLTPLKNFILPGGSMSASQAQVARSVCRRAEREMVGINESDNLRDICLIYINRLSDWFFVLGRYLNRLQNIEDVTWDS